jgi:hypothetical protein
MHNYSEHIPQHFVKAIFVREELNLSVTAPENTVLGDQNGQSALPNLTGN